MSPLIVSIVSSKTGNFRIAFACLSVLIVFGTLILIWFDPEKGYIEREEYEKEVEQLNIEKERIRAIADGKNSNNDDEPVEAVTNSLINANNDEGMYIYNTILCNACKYIQTHAYNGTQFYVCLFRTVDPTNINDIFIIDYKN